MQQIVVVIALLLASAIGVAQAKDQPVMSQKAINTGWRFHRVDIAEPAGAQEAAFDDSKWGAVILPHTPRIEKYNEPTPWQGICWYRKTLHPDASWSGKRVTIQFGAAMQIADVWVNGRHATHHLGGYLPFSVEITPEANQDRPVEIAVRLDNRDTDLCPPGKPTKGLDFNYPGGLYRSVKVIVTNPVHISDPLEANIVAGGGIFVQYSDVSENHATIHVQTDVQNSSGETARRVTVRQRLVDSATEQTVSDTNAPAVIATAASHVVVRQSFTVDSPKLWDTDHPNLYTLVTTLSLDGVPVDEARTTIGIRSIVLDSRVRINGKEVHVVGSNRHQEYPYIEYALSPNASARDAQRIADAHLNYIRLSHYPQDPAFLDACDRLGILVQAPIPGWQIFQDNDSFISQTFQNIRDLIRRDRNHPSILFWEPNLNETDGPHLDWCTSAYSIAHEEYPGPECYTYGDGYPRGWQPGWDVRHFIREYGDFGFGGNESTSRHTRGEGEAAMLQQAWNFQWCHNGSWANWTKPSNIFYGDATWCMFDYNRGYYAKPCTCGMMDIFRLPKYVYYFFQSQRDPAGKRTDIESGPMVFIASDWTPRHSGGKVVVYSNCDEVELSLNGKAIARQKPDSGPDSKYSNWNANIAATTGNHYDNTGGHPFDGGNALHLDHPPFTFFNVPCSAGTIKAVGYLKGVPFVTSVVRTPGKPEKLKVTIDEQRIPLESDGADEVFVRVSILDDNGTIVPVNELPSLKIAADGDAELIGLDPIHIEAGVASVLLRAGSAPGRIVVRASAAGLLGAETTIETATPALSAAPFSME